MTETARIHHDTLTLADGVRVQFQRTLRIPESGVHDLPPGLGTFPLRRVEDYPDTAPASWLVRGGVMMPLYQREALWLYFDGERPAALQVGVGKVCAISGRTWSTVLSDDPQNYVALPEQPWLDGINSGDGVVRQFVAAPLGLGATVEGQLTGEETFGGIQLQVFTLTPEAQARYDAENADFPSGGDVYCDACFAMPDMGIGAGGRMRQEIYDDERPLGDYRTEPAARVFVHLCSAAQWRAITGEAPPPTPISAADYTRAGLPWFEHYDADKKDVPAVEELAGVKPVSSWLGPDDDEVVPPGWVIPLGDASPGIAVKDGAW